MILRLAACGIALLTLLGIAPGAAGAADSIETPLRLSPDESSDFAGREPVLDALPTNAVLLVTAGPFEADVTGLIEQCQLGDYASCSNQLPVRFDEDGRAEFQYLVTQPNSSACRAAAPRCIVRLRAADRTATAVIVFIDPLPEPGRIRLRPSTALLPGDRITVEVAGFPPGARVAPVFCAPPHRSGLDGCTAPLPDAEMTIGADGSAAATITAPTAPIGARGLPCDRRHPCGVSVIGAAVDPGAVVVPIVFADPPGAAYDPMRIGLGLGIAIILLLVALFFVRRTDWSAVGEAAAPEIDKAEYADLDAIVAELDAMEADSTY